MASDASGVDSAKVGMLFACLLKELGSRKFK